jgi:hypothetical protein
MLALSYERLEGRPAHPAWRMEPFMPFHWMAAALAAAELASGAPRPPTLADPIRGLDLWRGAKIGMSLSDVQARFPSARTPADPVTLTGGETDALELADTTLAGRPATARFYFKDAELVSVQLTLAALPVGRSADNMAMARAVAADLDRTYGEPYDCGDRSFSQIAAYGCKWLQKPLAVRLWYMDTAGQQPLFYVAYRQADDPGYNL